MPRPYHLTLVASLLAAALACSQAGSPAPSAADRATRLAQTAAALLTSTAFARFTPASPTPLPSATPLPTNTPAATAIATVTEAPDTPTPFLSPTPCENDSAFVSDLTVPDGTHFAPGAVFIKTWRLRNDGVCAWTTAYTFRYVSGDGMSGATTPLPDAVAPGATVDVSVTLTAPSGNGAFTGQWQLHSPAGVPFGTKPFVQIIVP